MTNPSQPKPEQKPEPRIDEDGVGWCRIECTYVTPCSQHPEAEAMCELTGDLMSVQNLCLPFQRQQTKEINRLRDFVQACADGEGNIIRNLEDHARLVLGPATETEGETDA